MEQGELLKDKDNAQLPAHAVDMPQGTLTTVRYEPPSDGTAQHIPHAERPEGAVTGHVLQEAPVGELVQLQAPLVGSTGEEAAAQSPAHEVPPSVTPVRAAAQDSLNLKHSPSLAVQLPLGAVIAQPGASPPVVAAAAAHAVDAATAARRAAMYCSLLELGEGVKLASPHIGLLRHRSKKVRVRGVHVRRRTSLKSNNMMGWLH